MLLVVVFSFNTGGLKHENQYICRWRSSWSYDWWRKFKVIHYSLRSYKYYCNKTPSKHCDAEWLSFMDIKSCLKNTFKIKVLWTMETQPGTFCWMSSVIIGLSTKREVCVQFFLLWFRKKKKQNIIACHEIPTCN